MTTKEVFNTLTANSHEVSKASYYKIDGSKLLRVSDHLPKMGNLIANNDEIEEALFVYVIEEGEISEEAIQENLEEVVEHFELIGADYVIVSNEDDFALATAMVSRFF